jgi:hypothetical protein
MVLPTFAEFRKRLQEEFGLQERDLSDLSWPPSYWHTSGTGLCWERLIPPGKKFWVPIPELPADKPMAADELLFLCRRLRINPRAFGLPWN